MNTTTKVQVPLVPWEGGETTGGVGIGGGGAGVWWEEFRGAEMAQNSDTGNTIMNLNNWSHHVCSWCSNDDNISYNVCTMMCSLQTIQVGMQCVKLQYAVLPRCSFTCNPFVIYIDSK